MLCQNNDRGIAIPKVSQINFVDPEDYSFLELETVDGEGVGCWLYAQADLSRGIQMYGSRFAYSESRRWVGNILWNSYTMPVEYAIGFMNALARSKDWSPITGHSEIFDKFRERLEITGFDFGFEEDYKGQAINLAQSKIDFDHFKK